MKNKIFFSTMFLSMGILMVSSCKKDQDPPASTEPTEGIVHFVINPVVGTQTFAFGTNYTDDYGNVYQFSRAEFYLSNMTFYDDDGNIVMQPGKYFVVRPTTATYDLGSTTADHIHEGDLTIGIDSVTNHTDPSTYGSDNALAPQTPSLHWSWNSGYIFLALEGLADRNADGTPETAFELHIGSDALKRIVNVHIHHNITYGATNNVTLNIDYGKMLTGVNMADPNTNTHTMDNMTLATQIANNLDSVFTAQ